MDLLPETSEPQVTKVQAREACLGESWVGRPGPCLAVKDHFQILSFPFPLLEVAEAWRASALGGFLITASAVLGDSREMKHRRPERRWGGT